MSLIPCDSCAKRVPEKLCQATWAWYTARGDRVAYRQRLCTLCYAQNVLGIDKPVDFDALTCPGCGIATDRDMDPVYLTVFVPGGGKQQFEFPTCAVCAAEIRIRAQAGAVQLVDRGVEGPGPSPSTPPATRESYWDSIAVAARPPTA